ncbi:MAG: MFS transporter [Wenzhouxiangellaceae bacterium]|nr:MFS transporter [Wenzhouxiangellaceae bacterium]
MKAIASVFTLLLGVAIILAGNGLVGTLLGVRGELEGLSASVLGLIMAGYFAGFMVGTFAVPRLIRRVGHIRAFAALASLASVAALLHGLYLQPVLWFILRIASGVCIVGLYIAIESWLNEQTTNEQRGHVFSAYMTTTLIGLGIGQLLLMAGDARQLELFALGSVLLSLGLVPVAMTDVHEPPIAEGSRLGLGKLYDISPLGVIGCIFAGAGAGAFWGLGPVFASAIGLDKGGIAAFMGLVILGGVIMLWPVGRLSDHFERRRVLAWTCVAASLAAAATAFLIPFGTIWVMAGGLAYGAFAFSIYSLAAAHTNDHLESTHILEVTSALQLLWAGGAIVSPIVAGLLMQRFGPESLMLFMGAMALAPAVFAAYRMRVSESIPIEDQSDFVPQFVTSPAALEMHPDLEAAEEVPAPDKPGEEPGDAGGENSRSS